MKSTLIAVMVTLAVLGGLWSQAGVTVVDQGWTPSGYVAASVSSEAISPITSQMYYNKPYIYLDGGLNLPAGFMAEVDEYVDLADADADNKGVDEFDAYLWKTFVLPSDYYLKLRVAYWNCLPVGVMNGNDALAYDVFFGRTIDTKRLFGQVFAGAPVAVTAEVRMEYWHDIRNIEGGMITIMPSVNAECTLSPRLTAYEKIGLQWDDAMAPYGALLSGQLDFGAKVKVTKKLTWNVIDVLGIAPLTATADDDSRGKAIAFTTGVNLDL